MTEGSPTVPARRLGRTLRRLRESHGLSQVQVGQLVSMPSTTVSKYETADRVPSERAVKLFLTCFKIEWSSPLGEELLKLADKARTPGWWTDYLDVIADWFVDRLGLEAAANALWIYESGGVPGLLQTPDYARAVIAGVNSAGPAEDAERIAAVRAARQRRLNEERPDGEPLVLKTVLDEAVLRRQIGGPEVMRDQIVALREAADRPNITLQVLPFSAESHPGIGGPFTTIRFSETEMNTVYIELRGGAVYLDRPVDVERYVATFNKLTRLALTEGGTKRFLDEMLEGR